MDDEPTPAQKEKAPSSATDLHGKTVYVIDSHSLIHQLFHAIGEMTSPHGEPVAAVFGFVRDILGLIETRRPDYLFCAFDLPGKTFRHELYEAYKIHRPPMDADLASQIAKIRRIIDAAGVPGVGCESYEADDLLATIARQTEQLGGQCILVTADKDCRQLITDNVKLLNLRKNVVIDRDVLLEEWGIRPDQVVDYQALVGDATDGVPGVPQIGPAAAKQLLGQFGTLEAVLANPGAASGAKRQENLRTYGQQALLSRDLVRLKNDVPVAIDWTAAEVTRFHWAGARDLFVEYDFKSILAKLGSAETAETPADRPKSFTVHVVDTPQKLADFVEKLSRQPVVSFDTETTSLKPREAQIVGYSFSWSETEAWYVPVRAPEGEPCLDPAAALEALRPALENPAIAKIGQNLKYDMLVLRSAGVVMAGLDFDTMIADYLLDAGQRTHNLDDLAKRYLDHTTIKIEELIGSGKNQRRMDEVPVRQIADYSGEDALLPVRLRPILERRLKESQLDSLFSEVEIPLVEVLSELEFNGVTIDVDRLKSLSVRFGERMYELEAEVFQLAGRPFNLASPKQLQAVLFDELKLPVVKKTKTGPSTDAEVLEELAGLHPLPAKIVEYRQFAKLKSTYVDALPELVCPATGRVHTAFNQVVAATGRLSSSDPNLQNIPIRTEEGREIRSAFVPGEDGWALLSADYSQIELRVLAHYSEDARLSEAFARDEDIHAQVASQIYKVPLAEVTDAMRRQAKAVNFGVIYGQSPFGLAKQLSIPQEEASRFISSYFEGYPGVEKFLEKVLEDCSKTNYVSTMLGRRRAIDGVREASARPKMQKNLAERTAVNTVIQGSAADLIKLAMLGVYRRIRREGLPARLLLQIHDELVLEVPVRQVDHLARLVREEMVGARALRVPLKVDISVGPNWADAEPWTGD